MGRRLFSKIRFYLYVACRTVLQSPAFALIRLAIFFAGRKEYKGLLISDINADPSDDQAFVKMVREALDLIELHDPLRFRRIQANLRWIVSWELLSIGVYRHGLRMCIVDFIYYRYQEPRDEAVVKLALLIVHEATHGHLYFKQIGYVGSLRIRCERLCRKEEARFARKLGENWINRLEKELTFDPKAWEKHWGRSLKEKWNLLRLRMAYSWSEKAEANARESAERGDYESACYYSRERIGELTRVYGDDSIMVFFERFQLARWMSQDGKFDEAETFYREQVERVISLFGPEHEDSLVSRQSFAVFLYDHERYEEAEAIHREVIATRKTVLGVENEDTLWAMYSLAVLLEANERKTEAIELCHDVLAIRKEHAEEDDEIISMTREKLGRLNAPEIDYQI